MYEILSNYSLLNLLSPIHDIGMGEQSESCAEGTGSWLVGPYSICQIT